MSAAVFYLAGVQLPTVVINLPLNNALQRFDVGAGGPAELRKARGEFEGRWNRSNVAGTVCAAIASALYLTVVAHR